MQSGTRGEPPRAAPGGKPSRDGRSARKLPDRLSTPTQENQPWGALRGRRALEENNPKRTRDF